MEPIFELPITLPPKGSRERLRSLYGQLRTAILDGRLQPDSRLPSTRCLASAVGVSRNTAVAVYDLLLSEGYLTAQPGAGTHVAAISPRSAQRPPVEPAADSRLSEAWRQSPALPVAGGESFRFDFGLGLPDKSSFPFPVWRRLSARASRDWSKTPAVYDHPQGRAALRAAIAKHVSFALSAKRRLALLEFSQERRAVVVEDDYDGEFRLGGRPLDALQTLDRSGSVCYVGTFSKGLFPELRLGFVVAPPWAVDALVAAKACADWYCPTPSQVALVAFIDEGHLARHVRKMGKIYAERRAVLLRALSRYCGDWLQPLGDAVCLHLAVRLDRRFSANELATEALADDIRLHAVDRYAVAKTAAQRPGIRLRDYSLGSDRREPRFFWDAWRQGQAVCHSLPRLDPDG